MVIYVRRIESIYDLMWRLCRFYHVDYILVINNNDIVDYFPQSYPQANTGIITYAQCYPRYPQIIIFLFT